MEIPEEKTVTTLLGKRWIWVIEDEVVEEMCNNGEISNREASDMNYYDNGYGRDISSRNPEETEMVAADKWYDKIVVGSVQWKYKW